MANKKRNELAAGIFVIAGIAIVLGVLLWLGSSDLFEKAYAKYTFASDAKTGSLGLGNNAGVYLGDIKVGKISYVSRSDDSSKILYHVIITKPDFKLKTDATAKVKVAVLDGSALMITSTGSAKSKQATVSTLIKVKGAGIEQTFEKLSSTADTIAKAARSIETELDPKNKTSAMSKIKMMIQYLLAASGDIQVMVAKIKPEFDPKKQGTIAANIKDATGSIKSAAAKIDQASTNIKSAALSAKKLTANLEKYSDKDLSEIIANVRKISTEILSAANNIDTSSEKIKTLLVTNSDSIDSMIDNMMLVSANLNAASKEIRRNPWRLFYKPDKKKTKEVNIYDAARAFDSGATQLNMVVTKLKALQQMDQNDPQVKKQIADIKAQLLESFKKFRKVEQTLWDQVDAK